jgi:hypothetical protein
LSNNKSEQYKNGAERWKSVSRAGILPDCDRENTEIGAEWLRSTMAKQQKERTNKQNKTKNTEIGAPADFGAFPVAVWDQNPGPEGRCPAGRTVA